MISEKDHIIQWNKKESQNKPEIHVGIKFSIKASVEKKRSCSLNAVGKTGKKNYLEQQRAGDESS